MKKFFQEFKEFAMRGNVMDLAVGVIVGGAFSSITTSLINDIIMPIIGIFVSEASFADLYFYTNGAMITYGNFLQAVLNFIIMAFIVFCMVKAVNRLTRRKKAEAPPPPPEPSAEEKLLTEIRDLLKDRKQ
ncbi:MAG: large-conductance mechanosensitive channel protein MscL [Oscillospiraceae bacterium]|jgi:large conductance mechanosensitive channel|nr:large-conductance mechanosensitive channel protein MscL [Oscillospiraceae bacterium]